MPLPIITASENKKQLTRLIIVDSISQYKEFHEYNKYMGRLLVTRHGVTPMEISNRLVTMREDMTISHAEGDTIIIQQAFTAGRPPKEKMSTIANYTGVFVLLIYYYSVL